MDPVREMNDPTSEGDGEEEEPEEELEMVGRLIDKVEGPRA